MTKPLTAQAQYGLMRPVARIAQSVEQGIENPCVLGSIPSPGTIFKETRLWRVFCFQRYGLSIELRSMTRLDRLALRANGKAVVQTPAALVRVRAPYLKKPAYGGFFAFRDTDSPYCLQCVKRRNMGNPYSLNAPIARRLMKFTIVAISTLSPK